MVEDMQRLGYSSVSYVTQQLCRTWGGGGVSHPPSPQRCQPVDKLLNNASSITRCCCCFYQDHTPSPWFQYKGATATFPSLQSAMGSLYQTPSQTSSVQCGEHACYNLLKSPTVSVSPKFNLSPIEAKATQISGPTILLS